MNLLLKNKYGIPSQNFVKKNVLCGKGDEITRFDGIIFNVHKNGEVRFSDPQIPIRFVRIIQNTTFTKKHNRKKP
jgi:hypothetical protein